MDESVKFRKQILVILVLFGFLFIVAGVWSLVNSGKTSVEVVVIPEDATVTMNGKESESGNYKLEPGTYTFTASKEGFKTDKYTIVLEDNPMTVNLLPSPESEEALKWLENNPNIQQQREALGGERANEKGEALQDANPIIKELPYSTVEPFDGVFGPFSIDFGPSPDRPNGIVLTITSVSPKGRHNALLWMNSLGYDPVDYEIYFPDYENPFSYYADFSNVDEVQ